MKSSTPLKSSKVVTLGITALMAATLTGCSPSANEVDADYAKVCQDKVTEERLEDDQCNTSSSSRAHWYFIPIIGGRSVPRVGAKLSGGVATMPSGKTAKTVPSKGGDFAKSGSVTRGGFGSKGGGAGS